MKTKMGKRSEQSLHKERLSSVREICNKVHNHLITHQIGENQSHSEMLQHLREGLG